MKSRYKETSQRCDSIWLIHIDVPLLFFFFFNYFTIFPSRISSQIKLSVAKCKKKSRNRVSTNWKNFSGLKRISISKNLAVNLEWTIDCWQLKNWLYVYVSTWRRPRVREQLTSGATKTPLFHSWILNVPRSTTRHRTHYVHFRSVSIYKADNRAFPLMFLYRWPRASSYL